MTFISDLTARAISFITAVQTALVNAEIDSDKEAGKTSILTISDHMEPAQEFVRIFSDEKLRNKFTDRGTELVWISSDKVNIEVALDYALKLSANLVEWISSNREKGISKLHDLYKGFPTPYNWKATIEKLLYDYPGERVTLAIALQYLPIQIILGLGGGDYGAAEQRIVQMWHPSSENKNHLLNTAEQQKWNQFNSLQPDAGFSAEDLLLSHSKLISRLIDKRVPLSFELIFHEELNEIEANRNKRREEEFITGSPENSGTEIKTKVQNKIVIQDAMNPFEKVKQMGVWALAFSGGGIRSATFNLGILQGLAEKKLIGKFDYLSTVSGGGYIGSWLTAWIKRNESVVKVSNRLCTTISPDPSGAELKPIKWLRMYSNYFSPDSSIMSVDSWTVGITWLRNTLLNQIVIFLVFLSLLFAGNFFYELWSTYLIHHLNPSWLEVGIWSFILLFPVALLSGLGMYAYHEAIFWRWNVRGENANKIGTAIIIIALVGAYLISSWLSSDYKNSGGEVASIYDKIEIFAPTAVVSFVCLYIVAYFGKYVDCIMKFTTSRWNAQWILFFFTLLPVGFGLICLAFVSSLLENMPTISLGSVTEGKRVLQFILGVPMTLEVFAFTIVARMGLLGKYFPDERREWWGRIGASIHRICFFWILVFTSALIGWTFIQYAFHEYALPSIAATGGWVALVGACVRAAFSSKSAGKGDEKGPYASFLKILSMVGPYLFILGLLILLPAFIQPLLALIKVPFLNYGLTIPILLQNFLVLFLCAAVAYLMARQLGVNEFSMYNFYKNRLVRAYLGGTRRSTTRQKSANAFTGFDREDDQLLKTFRNKEGYHGPYQVLNCALNASQGQELDRQDRKAESFIFSPLFCGFDFSMARDSTDSNKSYDYAFRETGEYAFNDGGPFIGTAMAISGAAVNPNQGYHSSPPIAFLLTIFNAQMGRWLGNPRKQSWLESDPKSGLGYMISDLINKSSTRDRFISLSDGGHFDNMGLYEMVRRKCPYIILCDAEQDGKFTCEGLANAIRRCRIDFGAEIEIDISQIVERTDGRHSKNHYALGKITYVGENQTGVLLYIKSSIDGNEPVDVYEYALKNETFPHQTTADQFFNEEQFESYRKLGLHIAGMALSDKTVLNAFGLGDNAKSVDEVLEPEGTPFKAFYGAIKDFFKGKKPI
jgi:hypothetical protein